MAEFEEFQDPIPELMSGLISFSKSEESYGSKILRIYGDNFVCLNVRDSAYDIHLGRSENFVRRNRNSKIEDFESLIQYLVDKNITVFRMGVKVNSSPNITNVRFVDYAKNGLRSELLDLFLGANCKFAVSTSTGWDAIPELFLRPLLLVNVLDIFRPINLARRQLVFPKIFWSVEKNRPLTLDECISVTLNLRTSLKLGSSIEIGLDIRI